MAASIAIHKLSRPVALLVMLSGALIACGSDSTSPSLPPAVRVLQFDDHAVNLALTSPYDTVRVHATAHTTAGDTVGGTIRYHGTDSTVTVDSITGLVTARYTARRTAVIATLSTPNLRLADTVRIRVSSMPLPTLHDVSLHAQVDGEEADSAKFAIDGEIFDDPPVMYLVASDSVGNAICSLDNGCPLLLNYQSANPVIMLVDGVGNLTPVNVGTTTVTVSTLAYGVRYTVSHAVVTGYPIDYGQISVRSQTATVGGTPQLSFYPPIDTIGTGGKMTFINENTQLIDVVFDDSTNVSNYAFCVNKGYGGNIAPFTNTVPDSSAGCKNLRIFRIPGTFHYHSRLFSASGTIVVQ